MDGLFVQAVVRDGNSLFRSLRKFLEAKKHPLVPVVKPRAINRYVLFSRGRFGSTRRRQHSGVLVFQKSLCSITEIKILTYKIKTGEITLI
jgi:hypothetical protein